MKKVIPIFPSLIYEDKPEGFLNIKNGLIDYIYNLELKNPSNGNRRSNIGGWQSDNPKFYRDDPEFQPYCDWIISNLKQYTEFMNFKKPYDFNLDSMWVNINRRFHFNISHHHPNSHLAGVLWIKTPRDCGEFTFESPNEFTEYQLCSIQNEDMIRKYLSCPGYTINPEEGKIIIFPSHLRHFVTENLSDQDRISIAFNMTISV